MGRSGYALFDYARIAAIARDAHPHALDAEVCKGFDIGTVSVRVLVARGLSAPTMAAVRDAVRSEIDRCCPPYVEFCIELSVGGE